MPASRRKPEKEKQDDGGEVCLDYAWKSPLTPIKRQQLLNATLI